MMEDLPNWVMEAAGRVEVRDAVWRVYREMEEEIARRRPLCVLSGRCCRFDEYGHRLYVTTMELAAFSFDLAALQPGPVVTPSAGGIETGTGAVMKPLPSRLIPLVDTPSAGGCRFQAGKTCGVHSIRPMGCRLFFCDASSTRWQQEQYERFHADLKRLHHELTVPYAYLEWRAALEGLEGRVQGFKGLRVQGSEGL